ncbi:toxin A [Actinobacteria bacterium OK074]|nr:toxin A [Actinobacteria bacterium OK074]
MSHPHPTAVPEQGALRRHAIVSMVTLLLALTAVLVGPFGALSSAHAANNTCPGESHSGEGSSSGQGTCSNLHNDDLLDQPTLPGDLYRGDSRQPYEIFTHGFAARGTNYDVVQHVRGDRAGNSGYISTTGATSVARQFARSQGQRNLDAALSLCAPARHANYSTVPGFGRIVWEGCANGQVTADSFIYAISPAWARNAMHIPSQIRGNSDLYNHYQSQDEWAYVHRIPNYAINGVYIYRMTAQVNRGGLVQNSITFNLDHFVINPYYLQSRTIYDPASDAQARWNFRTRLNIPSLPANSYNRGCSRVDRCRDGSGGSGGSGG